jgi:hypothetical protein
MAELETFRREIRRQVPGCPEPTLDDAIIRAAQAFCKQSWFVQRDLEVSLIADQQEYTLTMPTDEVVIGVQCGTVDGQPCLNAKTSVFGADRPTARPRYFCFRPSRRLVFDRKPDEDYAGLFTVVVQPMDDAATLPDELADEWKDTIAAGALEWLYGLPKQPWTAMELVADQRQKFSAGITNAKLQQLLEFQNSNFRVQGASFSGVGR